VGTAGLFLYFVMDFTNLTDFRNMSQQKSAGSVIWRNKNTVDETSPTKSIKTPLLSVVTAFSSNHLMEGVLMLRSLIEQNYTGPIDVYLMQQPNETLPDEMRYELVEELQKSPLNANVIEYEAAEAYITYCFKPKVIQDSLVRATKSNTRPTVLMWADASTRFRENPEVWANAIQQDGVDFAGRTGRMGMSENTHFDTYKYFNMSQTEFKDKRELAANFFVVNLIRDGFVSAVLQPWFDCAHACTTCMAPVGSHKREENRPIIKGPPSTKYVSHRQDQSVLGLLVYDWLLKQGGSVRLDDQKYIHVFVRRGKGAKSISDLNPNPA
jgi:hypothetical protein